MSRTPTRWLPSLLFTAALPLLAQAATPPEGPAYGAQLEGFEYPIPSSTSPSSPRANRCRWAIWTCRPKARSMAVPWC